MATDEEALDLLREIRADVAVIAAKVRELDEVISRLKSGGGFLGRLLGG